MRIKEKIDWPLIILYILFITYSTSSLLICFIFVQHLYKIQNSIIATATTTPQIEKKETFSTGDFFKKSNQYCNSTLHTQKTKYQEIYSGGMQRQIYFGSKKKFQRKTNGAYSDN